MFTVSKRFTFSAAHRLEKVPEGHPCSKIHGHNYSVEVILQSVERNEMDMVVDYHEVTRVVKPIMEKFDHSDLNQWWNNPTAENIAVTIFDIVAYQLPQVVAVRVSETENTWAEYRGGKNAGE